MSLLHAFFEKYNGLEFVDEDLPQISEAALSRVKYTHKFYGKAGSTKDVLGAICTKGQKLLGVDKTKKYKDITFTLAIPGKVQKYNALTAIKAIEKSGFDVSWIGAN